MDALTLGKMPCPLKQKVMPPIMSGSDAAFTMVVAAPAAYDPVRNVPRTCVAPTHVHQFAVIINYVYD